MTFAADPQENTNDTVGSPDDDRQTQPSRKAHSPFINEILRRLDQQAALRREYRRCIERSLREKAGEKEAARILAFINSLPKPAFRSADVADDTTEASASQRRQSPSVVVAAQVQGAAGDIAGPSRDSVDVFDR